MSTSNHLMNMLAYVPTLIVYARTLHDTSTKMVALRGYTVWYTLFFQGALFSIDMNSVLILSS